MCDFNKMVKLDVKVRKGEKKREKDHMALESFILIKNVLKQ